jgi:hypothetical protein
VIVDNVQAEEFAEPQAGPERHRVQSVVPGVVVGRRRLQEPGLLGGRHRLGGAEAWDHRYHLRRQDAAGAGEVKDRDTILFWRVVCKDQLCLRP